MRGKVGRCSIERDKGVKKKGEWENATSRTINIM